MRAFFAATLIVIGMSGCASTGVQVSPEAATQFKEGVSTEADITKALGAPTTVTISGGRKFISYTGLQYQVKGATFIPIVGAFAGGTDYKMSSATYEIGADGVLARVIYSQSGGSSRAGLAPADMTPTEPRAVK